MNEDIYSEQPFPQGPWTSEHDFELGTCNGHYYVINRNVVGALCGYINTQQPIEEPEDFFDVHGGITYRDKDLDIMELHRHDIDQEGMWYGFDCSHLFDTIPAFIEDEKKIQKKIAESFGDNDPHYKRYRKHFRKTYKDIDFVRKEIQSMVKQLDGDKADTTLTIDAQYPTPEPKDDHEQRKK